jgi:hypothetical protein
VADTTEKPAAAKASAKATAVPEGHTRVMWVYCAADTSKNGTVEDVPELDAKSLIEGNRAKAVDASTPLGRAARKTRPERSYGAGAGLAPGDTSSGGEAGSATAGAR